MKITTTFSMIIFILINGCQKSQKINSLLVVQKEKPEKENSVQPEFIGTIEAEKSAGILSSYLSIKNALVSGDARQAAKAAKSLLPVIHGDTDQALKIIYSNHKAIGQSEDVAEQRVHFYPLSEAVYAVMKVSKKSDTKLYKQYCPMAFDDTGAWWLSDEKKIMNPYFGNEMLHCGMVQEEF